MKYRKPRMTKYDQQLQNDHMWEDNFNLLLKYRDMYGTLNVPNSFRNRDIPFWEAKLGRWVNTQRQNCRKAKLEGWRYDKLVSVGFDFKPRETQFEEHFKELLEFKAKFGHTLVPRNYVDNLPLSKWVSHTRFRNITDKRKARLDEIGFCWDVLDERFEKTFNELAEYKMKFGKKYV